MTRSPAGGERSTVDIYGPVAAEPAAVASVWFCQATAEGEPALPMPLAAMQPQGMVPYRTICW